MTPHRSLHVALLGFSSIERGAIAAAVAAGQGLGWTLVTALDDGELLLADAEDAPAVRLVLATERLADTIFVGEGAPEGAAACVPRPIDPRHLVRELDALLAARQAGGADIGSIAKAMARLQATASPSLPPPPRTSSRPAPAPRPAALAALVVQASEDESRQIAQPLQRWGFEVEQVSHSGQALARLGRRRFDCVFVALTLGPNSALDGLGLCQLLKRLPRPSRGAAPWVALLSASNSQAERVQGALAGCDAFLAQPVQEAELLRLLWRQGWAPPPPREPAPGRALSPAPSTQAAQDRGVPAVPPAPAVPPSLPQPARPPAEA